MTKTVLVADDSATMRRTVRHLLEERNSQVAVQEAIDGADAIEKAEQLKPDLIVLDFSMPRVNGAEAAAAIKKALPETPIIMYTMYAEVVGSLCSAIGVDVVSKPDGISKLLERVDDLFPTSMAASAD